MRCLCLFDLESTRSRLSYESEDEVALVSAERKTWPIGAFVEGEQLPTRAYFLDVAAPSEPLDLRQEVIGTHHLFIALSHCNIYTPFLIHGVPFYEAAHWALSTEHERPATGVNPVPALDTLDMRGTT